MTTATLRYARLTADPAANWTAEAANVSPTQGTFDSVLFTAHKLAAIVVSIMSFLEDAANVDQVLQMSIAKSLALALDSAALYGSGTPPTPQGLHGVVTTVAAGGTPANYDKLLSAIADVRAANFEPKR